MGEDDKCVESKRAHIIHRKQDQQHGCYYLGSLCHPFINTIIRIGIEWINWAITGWRNENSIVSLSFLKIVSRRPVCRSLFINILTDWGIAMQQYQCPGLLHNEPKAHVCCWYIAYHRGHRAINRISESQCDMWLLLIHWVSILKFLITILMIYPISTHSLETSIYFQIINSSIKTCVVSLSAIIYNLLLHSHSRPSHFWQTDIHVMIRRILK